MKRKVKPKHEIKFNTERQCLAIARYLGSSIKIPEETAAWVIIEPINQKFEIPEDMHKIVEENGFKSYKEFTAKECHWRNLYSLKTASKYTKRLDTRFIFLFK